MQRTIATGEHVAAAVAGATLPVRHSPARRFDDRDQRLYIVRLESRLDDDIDLPHREQRIAIAVAAVAYEARPIGYRAIDRCSFRRVKVTRIGRRDDCVPDARAGTRLER